jgi:hypothetical protein
LLGRAFKNIIGTASGGVGYVVGSVSGATVGSVAKSVIAEDDFIIGNIFVLVGHGGVGVEGGKTGKKRVGFSKSVVFGNSVGQ